MADEVRQTDIDQFKDHNLKLQEYFPYRLARLAEQVSLAVAEVYADRFALSRQEWRI
ncbi:MAG: MarR family transcriptional regulator, partial [Bradyrhizobium sp.]|nr:MarR family transcriptional regulator [Bradyrhizobium sp.]